MGKQFGVIGGRVISCEEAVEYRDTVLVRQYDALVRGYDAGRAQRKALVLAELQQHLDQAEIAWKKADAAQRGWVFGQIAALAVGIGGGATAKWATSRGALSAVEKAVAQEIHERGVYAVQKIAESAFTAPDIKPVEIGLMGASLVIAVAGTAAMSGAVLGAGLVYGGVQTWMEFSQHVATKAEYASDAATMRAAMTRIANNSVEGQIDRLLKMTNEIAGTCA
jgi:hypothetical protein